MKPITRSYLAIILGTMGTLFAPMAAQAYSNEDIGGCYAMLTEGSTLNPATMEWLPTASIGRMCANRKGTITWAWVYTKIGACALITGQISGPSTYSVNQGGGGQASMTARVVNVQDLCAGMAPPPGIPVGETLQFTMRFYLDKEGTVHMLPGNIILPNNSTMPLIPGVDSGTAWRQ